MMIAFDDRRLYRTLDELDLLRDPEEVAREWEEKLHPWLDTLPPLEADIMECWLFRGMRQVDIAYVFGFSQPSVCYRLHRAKRKLAWAIRYSDITEEALRRDLAPVCARAYSMTPTPVWKRHSDRPRRCIPECQMEILVGLWRTHNQTEVSQQLGIKQETVSDHYRRLLGMMKRDPRLARYVEMYETMPSACRNGNAWERRGITHWLR